MRKLIAFYSRDGENYFNGVIKNIDEGNTEKVAKIIQDITGGDLFKIEQKEHYSKNYRECAKQAKIDLENDHRPELVSIPDSLDQYDEIYLGYPNYWGTIPMAVVTFLTSFDFEGKTIHPFCTHEGSGLGHSIADIKKYANNATVMEGLAIHGSEVDISKKTIEEWVE